MPLRDWMLIWMICRNVAKRWANFPASAISPKAGSATTPAVTVPRTLIPWLKSQDLQQDNTLVFALFYQKRKQFSKDCFLFFLFSTTFFEKKQNFLKKRLAFFAF
jgi:hypothetical protein